MNEFRWLIPDEPRILDYDLQVMFISSDDSLEQQWLQPQMTGARFCGN